MQRTFQQGKKTRWVVVIPKFYPSTVDIVRQDKIRDEPKRLYKKGSHVEPG